MITMIVHCDECNKVLSEGDGFIMDLYPRIPPGGFAVVPNFRKELCAECVDRFKGMFKQWSSKNGIHHV